MSALQKLHDHMLCCAWAGYAQVFVADASDTHHSRACSAAAQTQSPTQVRTSAVMDTVIKVPDHP